MEINPSVFSKELLEAQLGQSVSPSRFDAYKNAYDRSISAGRTHSEIMSSAGFGGGSKVGQEVQQTLYQQSQNNTPTTQATTPITQTQPLFTGQPPPNPSVFSKELLEYQLGEPVSSSKFNALKNAYDTNIAAGRTHAEIMSSAGFGGGSKAGQQLQQTLYQLSPGGMLTDGQTGTPVENIPTFPPLDSTTVLAPNSSGLISKIYEDELGRALGSVAADQGALDYWTSRLQSGATADQIRAEIEDTPEGIVFDAYVGLFGREPAAEGREYWTPQLASGELTEDEFKVALLQSDEFLGDVGQQISKDNSSAVLGAINTGSIADLGTFFYNERQAGRKIPVEVIETLGYARTDDRQTAFEFAKGGQAYSEGLEALDQAIAQGDEQKAQELRDALANENTFFDYYEKNIASEIGQEAGNLRNETATGDVFGVGDPGKYVTTWLDRLGDSISDVAENPYVQSIVTLISPQVGSLLNAYATLDSGDDLTPAQIAAAIAGATDLAGLEGNLGNLLPPELREMGQAIENYLGSNFEKGRAALSRLFPNANTETLAKVEDYFRGIIGDENIETFSSSLAGFEDLIRGEFGSQQEQLDKLTAALAAEQQPSFTAPRGYQPGIDRPRLTKYEDSSVMAIMNQPSSIQQNV
jgi:hypothetical protein